MRSIFAGIISLYLIILAGDLAQSHSESADLASLVRDLHDEDPYVRADAAYSLGLMQDEGSVGPLIQSLNDSDIRVRKSVISALGTLGDPAAVEPLTRIIREEQPYTAEGDSAVDRHGNLIGYHALIKDDIRQSAAVALAEIGSPAVGSLLLMLEDNDTDTGLWAAHSLGLMQDEGSVDPLIRDLGHNNSTVRALAATILGDIGDRRALMPLVQSLKDQDGKTRAASAFSLGQIGDDRATGPLVLALEDGEKQVRAEAALWERSTTQAPLTR